LISALVSIALDIGEKVGKELRSYGANIVIEPKETGATKLKNSDINLQENKAFIEENKLSRIKTIFWKNNIVAYTPFLLTTAKVKGKNITVIGTYFDQKIKIPGEKPFITGLKDLMGWWKMDGRWPTNKSNDCLKQVLIGKKLAGNLGVKLHDEISLKSASKTMKFIIVGIVSTGGAEEEEIFAHLSKVQELSGMKGKVDAVQVSALTKPEDTLAKRAQTVGDPQNLSQKEYEKWYCTPYVDSIRYQIAEVIPNSRVKVVRQVASGEGSFIQKTGLLFGLIALLATLTAALGITATMSTAVLERQSEIGLMKALGAEDYQVGMLFLLEGSMVGLLAGVIGYLLGIGLTYLLGLIIFGAPIISGIIVLPISITIGLLMVVLGSAVPIRHATRIDPVKALGASI
jgi:putative ABC transport system permease protein